MRPYREQKRLSLEVTYVSVDRNDNPSQQLELKPNDVRRDRDLSRRDLLLGAAGVALGSTLLGREAASAAVRNALASDPGPPFGINKKPTTPFRPSTTAGAAPPLPGRIGFVLPSQAEFWTILSDAVETGAESSSTKIQTLTAVANNDPVKIVRQMESFLVRGVGGLVVADVNSKAQAPIMEKAIKRGVAVFTIVMAPSTSQVNADQYKIGFTQGQAAAKWIRDHLGGKAKVSYFNELTFPPLVPRHTGLMDALKKGGPGIEVVSDITVKDETTETGFKLTNTVLQAHPDANVFMGADSSILGSLAAIQAAGKGGPNIYLSGVNGDKAALAEMKKGGMYKASVAFAWEIMGYAFGKFAGDWLAGRNIPQYISVEPIALTSVASVNKFLRDMKNLTTTFKTPRTYVQLLGNIDYEHRNLYLKKVV
jgi:ribose transport system substrate-binding protein